MHQSDWYNSLVSLHACTCVKNTENIHFLIKPLPNQPSHLLSFHYALMLLVWININGITWYILLLCLLSFAQHIFENHLCYCLFLFINNYQPFLWINQKFVDRLWSFHYYEKKIYEHSCTRIFMDMHFLFLLRKYLRVELLGHSVHVFLLCRKLSECFPN